MISRCNSQILRTTGIIILQNIKYEKSWHYFCRTFACISYNYHFSLLCEIIPEKKLIRQCRLLTALQRSELQNYLIPVSSIIVSFERLLGLQCLTSAGRKLWHPLLLYALPLTTSSNCICHLHSSATCQPNVLRCDFHFTVYIQSHHHDVSKQRIYNARKTGLGVSDALQWEHIYVLCLL